MKNFTKKLIISALILLMVPVVGIANNPVIEDSTNKPNQKAELETLLRDFKESSKSFQNLEHRFSEYDMYSLNHRRRVLNWQYTSSIIIFIVVILIVIVGLILSYLHFKRSLIINSENLTELEFSKSGFKVRSSIIGIIILIISVVFFYLYLVHIYKISEIKPYQPQIEQSF